MKHLFLFIIIGMSATFVSAQNLKEGRSATRIPFNKIHGQKTGTAHVNHMNAARTTSGTPFATEDFSSGSATSMPRGWTTRSDTGAYSWQWRLTGDGAFYTIGKINSTTAANGFMMYNSDSIGGLCGCNPSGWLQSPAYNCSAHATVELSFEDYQLEFYDNFEIWVGTDSAFTSGTYQSYTLPGTQFTNVFSLNPNTVHLNISSVAAGKPAVYIRYVYSSTEGAGYSWMIDDMSLSEVAPVDIAIDHTNALYCKSCTYPWEITGQMPIQLMDTLYPVTLVKNYGQTAATADTIIATIYSGATVVYNKTLIVPSVAVNGYDTIANFAAFPGFYTLETGSYRLVCNAIKAGDADITNNTDTVWFSITDTTLSTYATNSPAVNPIYPSIQVTGWVYRASDSFAQMVAGGNNIAPGHSDTLTSVSVKFDTATSPGQTVGVQIYEGYWGSGDTLSYITSTVFRPLTATDISSGNAVFTFPAGVAPPVLSGLSGGNNYFAVVKCSGCTQNVVVSEVSSYLPIVSYSGYYDPVDPANDGNSTHLFDMASVIYEDSYNPTINLNFGHLPLSVPALSALANLVGSAFPDPANSMTTIPFTLYFDAIVNVYLKDMVGQIVRKETISATAGQAMNATIATGDLPGGIYIYTIDAGNERYSGKIAVTH